MEGGKDRKQMYTRVRHARIFGKQKRMNQTRRRKERKNSIIYITSKRKLIFIFPCSTKYWNFFLQPESQKGNHHTHRSMFILFISISFVMFAVVFLLVHIWMLASRRQTNMISCNQFPENCIGLNSINKLILLLPSQQNVFLLTLTSVVARWIASGFN